MITIQLSKYDIFLKVLESGSLTKAGELLGCAESVISQSLLALEHDLAITLLLRNRNGITLTSEGKQLLPYIQNICRMNGQLKDKIYSLKGICSGEVRIGAYHLIACHLLPHIIRTFSKQFPEITVIIKEGDYSEIREWIDNGTVDFGFLSIQDIDDLECIPYKEDLMYAVFPTDAPESRATFFDILKIEKYPFIYLDEGRVSDCMQIFKTSFVSPKIAYTVTEDDTVLAMVESHLGISMLPIVAQLSRQKSKIFIMN